LELEPVVAKTSKEDEVQFEERQNDLDSDESDHNSEAHWQQEEFKVNLRATAQSDFILTHRTSTGATSKL